MSKKIPLFKIEYMHVSMVANAVLKDMYRLVIDYGSSRVDLMTEEGLEEERILLKSIKQHIEKYDTDPAQTYTEIEGLICEFEGIPCQNIMTKL